MRQPGKVGGKRRAKRDSIDSVYAGLAFCLGVYPPLSYVVDRVLSCMRMLLLTNTIVIGVIGRNQRQRFVPSRLIGINYVVVAARYFVLGTDSS